MEFLIYSKTSCPYCTKAKRFLDERGLKYKIFELDLEDTDGYVKNTLIAKTNQHTVPNIFELRTSTHIGGYENLVRYVDDR